MPELTEVFLMMLDASRTEHSVLLRKIKCMLHYDRTKRDGTQIVPKSKELLPEVLKKHKFKHVSKIVAHGKKLLVEFATTVSSYITIAFSMGTGATFAFLTAAEMNLPYFHNRINSIIQFQNWDLRWVILDCSSTLNQVQWNIFSKSIKQMTNKEKGGAPTFLSDMSAFMKLMYTTFKNPNSEFKHWTLARLFTHKDLFNGLGAYLTSEIFHLAGVAPYELCGVLQIKENNILVKLISAMLLVVRAICRYLPHFDVRIHPKKLQYFTSFITQVYGKKDAIPYRFKGEDGQVHTIYSMKECKTYNLPVAEDWSMKTSVNLCTPEELKLVDTALKCNGKYKKALTVGTKKKFWMNLSITPKDRKIWSLIQEDPEHALNVKSLKLYIALFLNAEGARLAKSFSTKDLLVGPHAWHSYSDVLLMSSTTLAKLGLYWKRSSFKLAQWDHILGDCFVDVIVSPTNINKKQECHWDITKEENNHFLTRSSSVQVMSCRGDWMYRYARDLPRSFDRVSKAIIKYFAVEPAEQEQKASKAQKNRKRKKHNRKRIPAEYRLPRKRTKSSNSASTVSNDTDMNDVTD